MFFILFKEVTASLKPQWDVHDRGPHTTRILICCKNWLNIASDKIKLINSLKLCFNIL